MIRVIAAATAPELAGRCANKGEYDEDDSNVAVFVPWPDPADGHRIRVYPIAEHPIAEGRLGRIFRCSTVMINVLPESDDPRDPSKLSPHHHDDFEQVSLQAVGDYVHHMRVPWTPDSTTWRDDEHSACQAPSVVVIPPPLVHTSQAVGAMRHWLIDVFAPPRRDFSERPGWVLNRRRISHALCGMPATQAVDTEQPVRFGQRVPCQCWSGSLSSPYSCAPLSPTRSM